MADMKTVKLVPPAASFFESMRDIGYTLETALADIIDNSLTAKASSIDIYVDRSDEEFRIYIIDNGTGMDQQELLDAMRYASKDPRSARERADLGRFGLGLKLASLSQCKKLTVVTKKDGEIHSGIWDQDFIDQENDWILQIPDEPMSMPFVSKIGETGTLVLWEKLEGIDGLPDAGINSTEFTRRIDEARSHLELIFHRFIAGGEPGIKKCKISINNRPLDPLDPFNSSHPATITTEREAIGKDVSFQVYTLPHHSKVSREEWDHYAGQDGYLKNQGLYIYREKRLIIHGTWLRLTRQTELNKLTRVKIDITNMVDSEWGITLDKSRATLPREVRDRLRNVIERISASSKRVYTGRGQSLTDEALLPPWSRVQNKNEITYQINPKNPVVKGFVDDLSPDLQRRFQRIMTFVGSSLPLERMYADLNNDPYTVTTASISLEELTEWALSSYDYFMTINNMDLERALDVMKVSEPFKSNWERTENILGRERNIDD